MTQRGWSEQTINGVVAYPTKTVVAKDTPWDLASGTHFNDPATAYIAQDGAYVIRNDRTGVIVQISDRNSINGVAFWRNGKDGIATFETVGVKIGAKVEEEFAMRILLTGGTGLIGRALCQYWYQQGHELWVWSRTPHKVSALCSCARGILQLQDLDASAPFDAVVNLAGAPIADRRWTQARRALLWSSRVDLTRTLVSWIGKQPVPPRVLLSGSAVGWYGDRGDQWLAEAERARQWGVRVALLRTAPVLATQGGMLTRLPIFRLGLGGRLGSGLQWMPWIHIDDQVGLIDYLLQKDKCEGAFNACAPEIVRNVEFTQNLAKALHRLAILPVPAWVLRSVLGEMSVLLLGSQRIVPHQTKAVGFAWRYPTLSAALLQLIS